MQQSAAETIKQIELADRRHGGHFFDEDHTSHWKFKVLPEVYGEGRYLIVRGFAEDLRAPSDAGRYYVAEKQEDGRVSLMKTSPDSFRSARAARRYITGTILGYVQHEIDWSL